MLEFYYITSLRTSNSLNTLIGSTQAALSVRYSFPWMSATVNSSIKPVKYVDDTVIIELLSYNQLSQIQTAAYIINS